MEKRSKETQAEVMNTKAETLNSNLFVRNTSVQEIMRWIFES